MQCTSDHFSWLLLLLSTLQSIKCVPLGRLRSISRIRTRLSICFGLIPHIWAVPDHMRTVDAPTTSIRIYHAFTNIKMATLTTRLSVTLGISIIAFLGARLVPLCISIRGRRRITWVLVPLLKLGHVLDSKQTPTSTRTSLIWGPRFLAFSASLPPRTLFHFLCTYHQPSKVDVIMQHGYPIFILQIIRYTSHKHGHLTLLLHTWAQAYWESLTNFKEYSLTRIPP